MHVVGLRATCIGCIWSKVLVFGKRSLQPSKLSRGVVFDENDSETRERGEERETDRETDREREGEREGG